MRWSAALLLLTACASSPPPRSKTQVVVLGLIHGGHRDSLNAWEKTRREQHRQMTAQQRRVDRALRTQDLNTSLQGIHTTSYDDLIRERMQLYDQYFNDDLGPGGWTNINAAHYALIAAALDAHRGRRILITFGAWHKHWFLDKLLERSDIELVDPQSFFDQEP